MAEESTSCWRQNTTILHQGETCNGFLRWEQAFKALLTSLVVEIINLEDARPHIIAKANHAGTRSNRLSAVTHAISSPGSRLKIPLDPGHFLCVQHNSQ